MAEGRKEQQMDGEVLIGRAQGLLPAIRERAAEAERQRHLPEVTIKEMAEAGLFRVMQPACWGGYELDPRVFLEIGSLIGSACGSSGWVYSILCVHNWQLGTLPAQAQEDVWGADTTVRLASSYTPRGEVEVVDGGYRLRGRWQFSSGVDFADWAFLGGFRPTPDGGRELVSFLVPAQDYRVEDTWYVMGLRGTGSNDVVVEDAFVPAHRAHPFVSGSPTSDAPLFRIPFTALFGYSLTAPILGMATGALQEHVRYTAERQRITAGRRVAAEQSSQIRVAEAAAILDGVRAQLSVRFEELLEAAASDEPVPVDLVACARRDQVRGTRLAIEALDLVFANSGASAIRDESPIQRFWRDAHAGSVHNSNVPEPILAGCGALLLGQDLNGVSF